MAYSELLKNFEKIRAYMRQFYVYGFKSRSEFDQKSARSYDNERRRVESWLGDYMSFRQNAAGRQVFLSVDSRAAAQNPLYEAFKAKSFTDTDIVLHFYIMDLLADGAPLTIRQMQDAIADRYASRFAQMPLPEEATLRKKLKEYEKLGLLKSEKKGRELFFWRTGPIRPPEGWAQAVAFGEGAMPLGVIGSYVADRLEQPFDAIRFKHRYLLDALDSEPLYRILTAIGEERRILLDVQSLRDKQIRAQQVLPLKVCISSQNGRQCLLCWHYRRQKLLFFRLDTILSVKPGEKEADFQKYLARCENFRRHLWGVAPGGGQTEHIEMELLLKKSEGFVADRLLREKRCGTVTQLSPERWLFAADVYDAAEMLPWLRSFTGRIARLECSNKKVTERFMADIRRMAQLYGGGERDDLQ